MIELPHDNRRSDSDVDPVISNLASLDDDLGVALADSLDHPDREQVIAAVAAAICVQELARMSVTKIRMDAGTRSDIDSETVRSDWRVLCRHYAGSKHARILDCGIAQLEKLNPEQACEVIYRIRIALEPGLNRAMEEQVFNIGISLPVVGNLGIGNLRFNLRGTRVAMRSLGGRLIRLAVQAFLWLAVAAGTVHWTSWTFFDEPYLVSTHDGLAKLAQFTLVLSATLVVWAFARVRRNEPTDRNGPISKGVRFAAWVIVLAGWCHFLGWLLLGTSAAAGVLEAPAKLLLPFFLVSGGIAAWVSGRVFRGDGKNGE